MAWTFRNRAGHGQGVFKTREEAMSARRTDPAFRQLVKGRKLVESYSGHPGVIPDFPTHYNISMGRMVKNRAHHKQLQKELGCQDWEPVRGAVHMHNGRLSR